MKNIFENIPFGKLYEIPTKNGVTRPSAVRGSGCKMVNMGELFTYPRLKNPQMERVPMSESEKAKFSLKPGDLLFARQSLVLEGAGKCSIVLRCEENTTFESHIIRVRLDTSKADPLFYFYFFNSDIGFGCVQSIVNQVAAAGIRGSDLEKLKVLWPELSIQRKIAAVLSAYDDLIETNKKRIEILEKMAEELYREWFVRMRFPGYKNTKFVNGLPAGWNMGHLSQVATVVMGQSPKSEFFNYNQVGLPFHQGVGTYGKRFPEEEVFSSEGRRRAFEGDLLFSVRAPVGRLNIADREMIIGRGLAAISHFKRKNSYLYYLLKTLFQNEDIIGNGAIFNSVGKDELNGFDIHIHPETLINKFQDIAVSYDKKIGLIIGMNDNLTRTRDLLLPRLISGKLSVEDLDIQFPTSMREEEVEPELAHA